MAQLMVKTMKMSYSGKFLAKRLESLQKETYSHKCLTD